VYDDEALDDSQKQARKTEVMAAFRQEYQTLKASWGGFAGYDPWVARANNASFAAQAAYHEWVPAFEALFEQEGRNFARFYDAVRALVRLDRTERHAALHALAPARDTLP
jgi:predicted aminopeptidase